MAVSYPYTVSYFQDTFCPVEVIFDIQRNDELSGSGDGRVWQAELAPPLWTATFKLPPMPHAQGNELAAKIRKLQGSQQTFFLYDPTAKGPRYDPTGAILGSSTVTISSINTARSAISLQGLPANYVLTIGDRIQISYLTNPVKYAYIEVSETVTASSGGASPLFDIYPYLPTGITVGMTVTLIKAACRMILLPNNYSIGTNVAVLNNGMSFKAIQKK